ncbi:MAG: tRNA pseudouridine(55) synthase TruB [Erysipelotrichaceae bacterium]|nr:tRNA pseudouridine(55) synthase TruB [Erysipelotrichaceae bacterium]
MDAVLLINKPMNMTSFDICAKVRKQFHEKAVGHTGTLDPNATGLMIVLMGKYTKYLPYCQHHQKEYVATLLLGKKTTTGDIWGEIKEEKEVPCINETLVKEVLNSFLGASSQIPPMVSSIKVEGKRLYELAREGKEVERKARDIFIDEIELVGIKDNQISFRAVVSEGTYIRTLCEDIAAKLNTVGTMASLNRTKVAHVNLENAQSLEELREHPKIHLIEEVLDKSIPIVEIQSYEEVKNGRKIRINSLAPLVICSHQGEILAAYERTGDDYWYRCKRGLW